MNRFDIALNKKPPKSKQKKSSKKESKITKAWEKFAELNQDGANEEWIKSFNSMIDPVSSRRGVRLRRSQGVTGVQG